MEIYGNITGDLELVRTDQGTARISFGVAQDAFHYKDGQLVKDAPTIFFVTAWRSLAEGIAAALKKGDPVVVVGKWKASEFVKEGERRRSQWVEAEAVGPNLKFVDATLTKRARKAESADSVPAAEPVCEPDSSPFDE